MNYAYFMNQPKYEAQAQTIERLLKRTGFTLEEIARKTGINPRTLQNAAYGVQKLSEYKMKLLQDVGTLPVYSPEQISDSGKAIGDPVFRLRYVPVVSWAQAGQLTDWEDMPDDQMDRVAADTKDPRAFGVSIAGDSMEPNYREGETAILVPSRPLHNGNLVVAKIKNGGALLKLYSKKSDKIELSSYNPAYPIQQYNTKDFHWIYPVETVIKKVLH